MMVDIGYLNYISIDKIVSVKHRHEATKEDVNFYTAAEKRGVVIDMTGGKKRRSYVLTSDGFVYVTSFKSETIRGRINRMMGIGFDENVDNDEYPLPV
ncbi:extracellular matrix/biofilm biosynthesis regulator RemA family protein [Rhodococcus sp. IEGM1300]